MLQATGRCCKINGHHKKSSFSSPAVLLSRQSAVLAQMEVPACSTTSASVSAARPDQRRPADIYWECVLKHSVVVL